MRICALILFFCSLLAPCSAQPSADVMAQARQWCDTTSLDALEGIWLMPADNIYILMRRSNPGDMAPYVLTVLAALDTYTAPGVCFGELQPAADRKTFCAMLPTSWKKGSPAGHKRCIMSLADDGFALVVKKAPSALRFSLSPVSLLPHFWSMVRLSISPRQQQEVKGMVKIYPGYDGNGSDRHNPRYL